MISGLLGLAILGGFGFAVWSGLGRVIDPAERASMDAARVVRSAAIAAGMYLAMLAIAVGLIDVLQTVVSGAQIAGSNEDLARALSLLIVGVPVFGLLARQVDGQRKARMAAGDQRGAIGWSAHAVAALTTTLIGILVSAWQLIEDIDGRSEIDAPEVAQLAGWLVVWALYWFWLRPRFGMRGHLYLLIGTVLGLGWTVAGVVGFGNAVLDYAYQRLFSTPIADNRDLALWVMTAAVGLVTWGWHWRALDRDEERSFEERPRRSPAWFATVVGAGIVPGLIWSLAALGAALAGTLIWFFGTPEGNAAEWFDESPSVIVVGCVAVAVWAFHRWLLQRDGVRARNEALRFHDYVVAGVALIAVVSGVALVVSLVLDVVTVGSTIASSLDIANRLIGTLVLLGIGSVLWWFTWERIEQARLEDPVAESDSIWRKLYLIVAAGLGGLTFAACLIWILFAFLRDLLDGELGSATLDVVSGPLGWAIAVLAGVWFHVGVWRADRAVLETIAKQPPPPPDTEPPPPPAAALPPPPPLAEVPPPPRSERATPPTGLTFRWSTAADHGELFSLQRSAFVDEAMAYDTPRVPALTETFAAFQQRVASIRTLVAIDGTRLVGAVSIRAYDDLPWLERLMVAPDRRNEQLGHELVDAVTGYVEAEGHDRLRAVVGDRNPDLLRFYASLGFELVGRTAATDQAPELLVLERPISSPG